MNPVHALQGRSIRSAVLIKQKDNKMLFNLKQIKDAVDWTIGDDGHRGNEVVALLKQEYLSRPVNRAIEIQKQIDFDKCFIPITIKDKK